LFTILTAIVTAGWAVWRFTEDRRHHRRTERDRLAGLYVNPFLVACEDLQSRLYNILHLKGLGALRGEDLQSQHHPAETLYLIAQYFGWERRVLRYGPYTTDPKVMRLVLAIRATFATDRDKAKPAPATAPLDPELAGAFCFFRIRQEALGQIAVQRVDSSSESEFESVGSVAFQDALEEPAFAEMASVQKTLSALEETRNVELLPGRWRLAEVQNYLLGLLDHIEAEEGFTLFPKGRERADRNRGWMDWAEKEGWIDAAEKERWVQSGASADEGRMRFANVGTR
jgi:hypothetical protein